MYDQRETQPLSHVSAHLRYSPSGITKPSVRARSAGPLAPLAGLASGLIRARMRGHGPGIKSDYKLFKSL